MFPKLELLVLLSCSGLLQIRATKLIDPKDDEIIGFNISPAQAMKLRGYEAKEFFFKTVDGYVLGVSRGRNPLINHEQMVGRDPILFLHGANSSPAVWLFNSAEVRPKDFTHLTEGIKSETTLKRVLAKEPASKSLPFLAMNLGHEVWVMSRRGYPGSEQKAGHLNRTLGQILARVPESLLNFAFKDTQEDFNALVKHKSEGLKEFATPTDFVTSIKELAAPAFAEALKNGRRKLAHDFDPEYWDFTLDQQIAIDLPTAINFVRKATGRDKVAVVGHSTGSGIAVLALTGNQKFYEKAGE